jgi:hypothetical protein
MVQTVETGGPGGSVGGGEAGDIGEYTINIEDSELSGP